MLYDADSAQNSVSFHLYQTRNNAKIKSLQSLSFGNSFSHLEKHYFCVKKDKNER